MRKLVLITFIVSGCLRLQAQTHTDTLLSAPKKDLSTFIKVVNAAGLKNIFNGQPVTIFAPDNEAFDKFSANKMDSLLMPSNKSLLISTLDFHIIAGKLTAKDIAKAIHDGGGQATFRTLAGTKLNAKINANRNIVLFDGSGCESVIKVFNIKQGNADMFVIDSVLSPVNKYL
ncbi:fasciclin domain-containing protein [Mucilaginibacter sp. L196]|uniref:fasciclin domain-containing protein n=1 Tax=Mucilaginibacter sp. L196 TaxID=1641870 RepID=UPI00131D6723|nr:fasciclin domain-containing protein [Mucilaginibacter sp. L196]